MSADSSSETTEPQAPVELRRTLDRLRWQREQLRGQLKTTDDKLAKATAYLALADQVTDALDELSQTLFEQVLGVLREKLSICLLYTSPSPRDKRQSRMPSSA